MNRVFPVMVVSALLMTFGLAQTPDAGSNTDSANVKGCLGGSDGNYTVVVDGTRQIFKITTSSVDLKPHLGHDVRLVGHKAGATASPGAADNSFAVTELSMISEHCAAAAAAAMVIPPSETVIAPDPAPAVPSTIASAPAAPPAALAATATAPAVDAAATVAPSAAVVSTPAVEPVAPAATVTPPAAAPATPAVEAAVPAATVEPSPATPADAVEAAAPVANDTHTARLSAHARKLAAAKAAAATESAEPVSPSPEPAPAADAATPAATATPVSPSAETVSAPDTAAPDATVPSPTPAPTATHRTGSLALLIAFVVLVVVLGTTAPLIGRWRKRKMLERDGSPNLSFTNDSTATEVTSNDASSGRDKAAPRKVA